MQVFLSPGLLIRIPPDLAQQGRQGKNKFHYSFWNILLHQNAIGSFEPMQGAKKVLIDPNGSKGEVVRIGTTLSFE